MNTPLPITMDDASPMEQTDAHRDAFEHAYATKWFNHRSNDDDDTIDRLATEVKGWREGNTYGADLPRLRFGWAGYQWAIATPPVPAAEYGHTDFGYVYPYMRLSNGDARLMAHLVRTFGTDHRSSDDLEDLFHRANAVPPSMKVLHDVIYELRHYNPAADEYKGKHIHKGWAKRLEEASLPVPAAVSGEPAWQPIETAPKDGEEIIVFHPEGGVCAAFCPGEGFAWHCMDGNNTGIGKISRKSIPRLTSFVEAPTHWMPLPPAPTAVKEGA